MALVESSLKFRFILNLRYDHMLFPSRVLARPRQDTANVRYKLDLNIRLAMLILARAMI